MAKKHEVEDPNADLLRLLKAVRGVRVRPTEKAIEQGIARQQDRGIVVGWGPHHWSVTVRKEGRKKASNYHVSFWRPAEDRSRG